MATRHTAYAHPHNDREAKVGRPAATSTVDVRRGRMLAYLVDPLSTRGLRRQMVEAPPRIDRTCPATVTRLGVVGVVVTPSQVPTASTVDRAGRSVLSVSSLGGGDHGARAWRGFRARPQ